MCISMNVLLFAFLNTWFIVLVWNLVKKRKTNEKANKNFPNSHTFETGMIVGIDRVISTGICRNTKYQEFFPEWLLHSVEVFPESRLVPEAAAFVASEHI